MVDQSSDDVSPFEDLDLPDMQSVEEEPVKPNLKTMSLFALLALAVWTALSDITIFRTRGYAGPGLFFFLAPIFLMLGSRVRGSERALPVNWISLVILLLTWAVAARLATAATELTLASGVILLLALATACWGAVPLVIETALYAIRVFFEGLWWLSQRSIPVFRISKDKEGGATKAGMAWSLLLPLAAVGVFGGIFIFANPDLSDRFEVWIDEATDRVWKWIGGLSVWEIPFCITAFVVGAGLLYPVFPKWKLGPKDTRLAERPAARSAMFGATRNMMLALIALFAVYLVFEFQTLWRRDFPEGFYYAGYAHQGAAWLTLALALATCVLSLVFSGQMLGDDRLIWIRVLSWIWTLQNLLLAAAVYNRLMIYVGYNGMTRLRTVGFFGTTLVVVGFLLVLLKIRLGRSFWWLIRAQLVALVLAVILYSIYPVDYFANRYNVARVNEGYLHPSVMIAVKDTDELGMLPMLDLVDCPDEMIAEGVKAKLAQQQLDIEGSVKASPWHWTRYQKSAYWLYPRLETNQAKWSEYLNDAEKRSKAIGRFKEYAMQWY